MSHRSTQHAWTKAAVPLLLSMLFAALSTSCGAKAIPKEQYLDTAARALCELYFTKCCNGTLKVKAQLQQALGKDVDECVEKLKQSATSPSPSVGIGTNASILTNPDFDYDAGKAGECINYYQNWNCETTFSARHTQVCQQIFQGNKEEGEACANIYGANHCKPGLYCHTGSQTGSQCRKTAQEGESCDITKQGSLCGTGLFCGEDKRCKATLPEGADCTQSTECDFSQGMSCDLETRKCKVVTLTSAELKKTFCE